MASYLQIENISKSYGPKVLFENIAFNINEGDKMALIAPNGAGKTSLMKILAGKDKSDSGGSVKFLKQIKIVFLEQEYPFDPSLEVLDQVIGDSSMYMEGLDETGMEEYRRRVIRILTELSIDPLKQMSQLSGGEVKRVAIARMLATEADFYIMDEPTNHLDIDAIEYLENSLKRSRCTLFMVTHDRYFLDRVCNIVMEMDHGAIYIYKGDYENYLTKRQERIQNYNAETDKVRNILRRELEWMHATPCARTGKAKYRKQAFWDLKERAGQVYTTQQVSVSDIGGASRLGSKIINCDHLSFGYGDKTLIKDFTYNFQRFEKVGIVGHNGVGKSTFLNLLVSSASPAIQRGESLKIGYYRQSGMEFDEGQTVLETVPNTHLLNQFLFPHDMFNNKVASLSGGERRRLYLLTILMQQPNLLVLDEPTNDLDIVTLNVLEEYLQDFKGSLIIVTHDRHFLDRTVDHLLVFCGDGIVKDFIGGYTEYRTFIKDYEAARKAEKTAARKETAVAPASVPAKKTKLTYKERIEFAALEKEMEELNAEKDSLEQLLSSGTADFQAINNASVRFQEVKDLLDGKEMRWLELSEYA